MITLATGGRRASGALTMELAISIPGRGFVTAVPSSGCAPSVAARRRLGPIVRPAPRQAWAWLQDAAKRPAARAQMRGWRIIYKHEGHEGHQEHEEAEIFLSDRVFINDSGANRRKKKIIFCDVADLSSWCSSCSLFLRVKKSVATELRRAGRVRPADAAIISDRPGQAGARELTRSAATRRRGVRNSAAAERPAARRDRRRRRGSSRVRPAPRRPCAPRTA